MNDQERKQQEVRVRDYCTSGPILCTCTCIQGVRVRDYCTSCPLSCVHVYDLHANMANDNQKSIDSICSTVDHS